MIKESVITKKTSFIPCGIGGFLLSVLLIADLFNAWVNAGVHSSTNTYIDASNKAWTIPRRKIFRSIKLSMIYFVIDLFYLPDLIEFQAEINDWEICALASPWFSDQVVINNAHIAINERIALSNGALKER